MNETYDKIMLLACSMLLFLLSRNDEYLIIPLLAAVLISSLYLCIDSVVVHLILFLIYLIGCSFYGNLCYFLPLVIYDLLITCLQYSVFFIFWPLHIQMQSMNVYSIILLLLFCILSYYLKQKSEAYQHLEQEYQQSVEHSTEFALLQEEKNRSLLENQDYEINIARLNERNRISREIHDHVGHVLSRSLIQIGALLTISKDPLMTESLSSLKDSLSEGMDSIRASVHNMHDESIDLYSEVRKLVNSFSFCPVEYEYDIVNPPLLKLKYCFIAIVKESLSNIIKHSDASKVHIQLQEEPSLYRLIISDNGTTTEKTKAIARRIKISNDYVDGMGLQNMMDRVKGFNGTYEIIAKDGFKIVVTISKENNGGN